MTACNKYKCANNCKSNDPFCQSGPAGDAGHPGIPDAQPRIKIMETTTQPIESLLQPAEFAQIFIELAKTGIKKLDFSIPALQDLSLHISRLVAENQHLRNLLGFEKLNDVDIIVENAAIRILFGQANQCELIVPVADKGSVFAQKLRRVATELEAGNQNVQLTLFDDIT